MNTAFLFAILSSTCLVTAHPINITTASNTSTTPATNTTETQGKTFERSSAESADCIAGCVRTHANEQELKDIQACFANCVQGGTDAEEEDGDDKGNDSETGNRRDRTGASRGVGPASRRRNSTVAASDDEADNQEPEAKKPDSHGSTITVASGLLVAMVLALSF